LSTKIDFPNPYICHYRSIPELFREGYHKELDTDLQAATRVNNLVAMKHWLRIGAMANGKNGEGMTPLQEVFHFGQPLMNLGNLYHQTRKELNFLLRKCKILIDHDACLDRSDYEKLHGFLRSIGACNPQSVHCFLEPRPRIGDTEVFIGRSFESLTQWSAQDLDKKDVVLFNIADEEFSAYYGAVSKMFHPLMDPFYAEIAKHFIVMRARNDSPNDLPVVLDYIEQILGASRVKHYILAVHARQTFVAFGEEYTLASEDIPVMQDVSRRLPFDAEIHVAGCSVAKREKNNFCWAFSKHSGDRHVHGAEGLLTAIVAKIFHADGPKLALFFDCGIGPPHVKTYRNGRVVLRAELTGDDVPGEVVRAFEPRKTKRTTENKEASEDFVRRKVVRSGGVSRRTKTKVGRRRFNMNVNPAKFVFSRF
jgi:hypothetical protein